MKVQAEPILLSHLLQLQTRRYTVIIQIEWQIQSSGRNSIFGIIVNPIMRKTTPLIISSESNLAEELQLLTPCSILSKTKRAKSWQMSLLSPPGNVLIKTTLKKSLTERCSDDRSSLSLDTSKVIQYYKKHLLGQKGLSAWLVLFLENMLPLQWQI